MGTTKRIIVAGLISALAIPVFGCTNILVSKGASTDGSTMVTYAADSHHLYGELYYRPAAQYPAGTMLDIYEWDTGKYLGKIRQARQTWSVVGNMNEHQLVIAETTFGGRDECVDSTAILDYGSLIYITLQRAKTARAAIDTMAALVNEYGYYSSGESFSIADANEVWIMEMVGKGSPTNENNNKNRKLKHNKGAVWVALKVPEGYICAHANQARIQQFALNDPENCKYSPDVISFARSRGWFTGSDSEFGFANAYAPITFEAMRFCEARVFSIFNRAAPSAALTEEYILGTEGAKPYPLFIKPDKALSIKDVMSLMRDHFQGTSLDMTKDIGAGPYACPYRWRPLTWKVDSVEYFNERAISTQQTGFSFVSQSRAHLPNCIGGVLWFGLDDTYSTVYMPIYCSITTIPHSVAEKNGDLFTFSPTSAFWAFNKVSNFAYLRYNDIIKDIQKEQERLENKFFNLQPAIEKTALSLVQQGNESLAKEYLNDYTIQNVENVTTTWDNLFNNLLVKYMDGNVKGPGHKVNHPGYPQWWYNTIKNNTNDKLKMKKIVVENK